jgi:hypothetical protein
MNQKFNMKKQILVATVVIAFIAGISSCEKYSFMPPVINPVDTIHFSTDIQPIFTANCVTCHGGLRAPDLREGKSYDALTTGGYVNQPGETSLLYTQMNKSDHAPRSSDAEKQKVLIWINQGALDN